MNVIIGFIKAPDTGNITQMKRKQGMNTANRSSSLGSETLDSKLAIMNVTSVKIKKIVATVSVRAAFHI